MKEDYARNISLVCPICGNNMFSSLDLCDLERLRNASDEMRIQCSDCKTIFSKAQIIKENQELLDSNIGEIKAKVVYDFKQDMKRSLNNISRRKSAWKR